MSGVGVEGGRGIRTDMFSNKDTGVDDDKMDRKWVLRKKTNQPYKEMMTTNGAEVGVEKGLAPPI